MKTWILEPFAWTDSAGGLHLDVPALLAMMGVKDTPEERERAAMMIVEILREKLPEADLRVNDLSPN